MANRVNVNITARDLTRGELGRMRRNFRNLGQDLDRVVTRRTRENFNRLSQSVSQARRDLTSMRGAIPDDEFFRMDEAIRRAQRRMQRGFGRTGQNAMNRIAADVRRVSEGFRNLDENARIRVRVDTSALRRADAQLAAWRRDQSRNAVRVRVDPDRRSAGGFRRFLMRSLTSPLRAVQGLVGGTLSDGVGQGIVGGVTKAGPVVGAILVAAIIGALTVAGAALSGLLITVLGAAFVGIGGISAAMSDQVKAKWSDVLESLKENFKSVGEPMIPVLERALGTLEKMADKAAPKLKRAIEDTLPATQKFIDSLMEGFETFGKRAFQPIMDAWNVFAPVFGEEWNQFMSDLGGAFADMANLVKEHPTEIAAALDVVFSALTLIVKIVTLLGTVWVQTMNFIAAGVVMAVKGFRFLAEMALDSIQRILDGIALVSKFVPGMGDKAAAAAEGFRTFREKASGDLDDLVARAEHWGGTLDRMNRVRHLKANIDSWNARLKVARAELKRTTDQKARAKLTAEISDLQNKVDLALRELARVNGKVARARVITTYEARRVGSHGTELGNAHGGVMGHAATGGIRSNLTMVGEGGPEIVDLPPGSHIRSNPDTRRTLRQNAGSAQSQFIFKSSGRRVDDLLLEILREAIQQRGGDPVAVLGG